MVIIIAMLASCAILVGISYLMLTILSGMIVVPRTPVRELAWEGELVLPLHDDRVADLHISADGRYLAFMVPDGEEALSSLKVTDLASDYAEVRSINVSSERFAWLGENDTLVFEDEGDIQLLQVADGTLNNLTASPELDRDPLPSPDGNYILWTRVPGGSEGVEGGVWGLWVMSSDGSDKSYQAPLADLVTWHPEGNRLVSRSRSSSGEGDVDGNILQTAVLGAGRWDYYAECEEEVRYIWWPRDNDLLYVSPYTVGDKEMGVWTLVKRSDLLKKVVSTEGLGYDVRRYSFYPDGQGRRLAYIGERGLEYLDYQEKVIYRYTGLDAKVPLAWSENADHIYYVGAGGIYRVPARGD